MTAKFHPSGDVKDALVKQGAKEGISGVSLYKGTKQADGSHEAGPLKNVEQLITENP
jgi:hypothetical protein